MSDLFRFQDRAYKANEIKGRAKRRYVVGFNEVIRSIEAKKAKLLIIARDIEPVLEFVAIKGESLVEKMKRIAQQTETPYVFSLSRRKIGYLLHKKVMVSCVAVLNYSGADQHFHNIQEIVTRERAKYEDNLENNFEL